MDGEVYHEQVLCLDGLTSDDDPEDRSSDVDSEDGVFQDPIPTVVSVRPEVTEKWMDRFVVDLVECPSVSKSVSEEYSPVVFAGGGGEAVADAYPLVVVESDSALVSVLRSVVSDSALSVLPVAGCEFRAVFLGGKSPLMRLDWALARRVS